MEFDVPQWLLITSIWSNLLVAGCVVALWLRGSPSTRARKSQPSSPATPSSVESTLAQIQVDQAALFSTLEKLTTTVKRLSSRSGMQHLREEREHPRSPPIGTPKQQLRIHYGLAGKTPAEIAALQQFTEESN